MRNILFVLDRDFTSNSAVHVSALANELCLRGLDCAIAVPRKKESVGECGTIHFRPLTFNETADWSNAFADGRGPDAVHCWTPREIVRKFCVALRSRGDFKLFIHLEDNEELLTEKLLAGAPPADEFPDQLAHPTRYREFLQTADGVTVIIDRLREFVPPGVPHLTLWPGVDTTLFAPPADRVELKRRYGIPLDCTVIVYAGNVHRANAAEVRSLYLAVALLNRSGVPTLLVRTGENHFELPGAAQNDSLTHFLPAGGVWMQPYLRHMGFVPRARMPEVLALADVFVQPGRADRFNEYRFPSKLPEFLALGRPLILPASNLGHVLRHEQDALVLEQADAIRITEAVQRLSREPQLTARLAANARAFAETRLSWPRQAARLFEFYQQSG